MTNRPIGNPGWEKASGNGTYADPWIQEVAGAVTVSGGATAANQTTQITAEQAIQATAGATTGAAVITDANGTMQQYLRGLVKLAITAGSFLVTAALAAGSEIIGSTKDAGPHWTSSFGITSAVVSSAAMTTAAALTDAPTAGQKIVITDILFSSDTAMRMDFQCETTGVVVASCFCPANGFVQITPRSKLKLATADKKLFGDASVAGNIRVTVFYYSEA